MQDLTNGSMIDFVFHNIFLEQINYFTKETFHFKKNLLFHNFLRIGVMTIKVYIFGEEIFCRIYLWSHILFLKLPVHEKNP